MADWGEAGWSDVLGSFDLIADNPPYIAHGDLPDLEPELRHEPVLALDGGADGLDAYWLLAKQAPQLLTPSGLAIFEVGAGQAQPVAELLAQAGFTAVSVRKDLAGIGRCVLAASP
jgi:release factor glutamine methyltransferase